MGGVRVLLPIRRPRRTRGFFWFVRQFRPASIRVLRPVRSASVGSESLLTAHYTLGFRFLMLPWLCARGSFEPGLQLRDSLAQSIEFGLGLGKRPIRGWRGAQDFLDHLDRRQNGRLDLAEAALHRILHLFIGVKGGL